MSNACATLFLHSAVPSVPVVVVRLRRGCCTLFAVCTRPAWRKSKQTRERWLGCGRSISNRTAPSARTHAHATYVMHTFFLEYVMHTLVSFPFSGGTKALNKSSSSRRKWCSVLTSATRPWIRASLFFFFFIRFFVP